MNHFIEESARLGAQVTLGFGVVIEEGVEIGAGVALGHHVVIRAGARIGPGTVVEDGAIIGRQPRPSPIGTRPVQPQPGTVIGPDCLIGSNAIIYAGVVLEDHVLVGDLAYVREGTTVHRYSAIGTGVQVGYDVTIGSYTKIQTGAVILGTYEDHVFIGPGVTTTDDLKMDRVSGTPLVGPCVKRGARVGGGAVLYPGLTVGYDAVVAGGAVVMRDVPDRKIVAGNPAKVMMDVPEQEWVRPRSQETE
jgi:acetyltransferase-like isoleucine patch superfamily enzyme